MFPNIEIINSQGDGQPKYRDFIVTQSINKQCHMYPISMYKYYASVKKQKIQRDDFPLQMWWGEK